MSDLYVQLAGLLEKSFDDDAVRLFIDTLGEEPAIYDRLGGYKVLAFRHTGIEIMVRPSRSEAMARLSRIDNDRTRRISHIVLLCREPKGGWFDVYGEFSPFQMDLPFGIRTTDKRMQVQQVLKSNFLKTTMQREPRIRKLSIAEEEQRLQELVHWRKTGQLSDRLKRESKERDMAPVYAVDSYLDGDCRYDFMFDLEDEGLIAVGLWSFSPTVDRRTDSLSKS